MDKRKLRAYFDPHLRMNQDSGLLHTGDYRFVVRTAIKNIAGHRTLLLYFYPTKQAAQGLFVPRYTMFQTRKEYLTLERLPDGKTKWRRSRAACLDGEYFRTMQSKYAFYTRQDAQRVTRFCRIAGKAGFTALERLQEQIYAELCWKRKKQRLARVRKRMKSVRQLPKGFLNWVHSEALPAHIFYEYRRKKTQSGYCTSCRKEVEVTGAQHAKKGVCPGCGRQVVFHAVGRNAHVQDWLTVQLLQKVGGELVLRVCKAWAYYRDYRHPTVSVWESARFLFSADGSEREEAFYYAFSERAWRKGIRPIVNFLTVSFEADTCGLLYTGNLKAVLRDTPWQYSQLRAFCLGSREPLEVLPYLRQYLRYPALEYLVKLGLFWLASDVVYRHGIYTLQKGSSFSEILGVPKTILPIMQQIDIGQECLKLMQKLCKRFPQLPDSFYAWCQENAIHDAQGTAACLQWMSAHKLMRYIDGQHEKLSTLVIPFGHRPFARREQVFSLHTDYLRFCRELGYDLTDDFICFPRDIKEAHDRIAALRDAEKAKKDDAKIAAAYETLKKQFSMNTKRYGLMIVPPPLRRANCCRGAGFAPLCGPLCLSGGRWRMCYLVSAKNGCAGYAVLHIGSARRRIGADSGKGQLCSHTVGRKISASVESQKAAAKSAGSLTERNTQNGRIKKSLL